MIHILLQLLENEGEESKDVTEDAELYNYQEDENAETIVLPATSEYKDIIADSKSSVRLVQIRIPPSAGDGRNWLNLVQRT